MKELEKYFDLKKYDYSPEWTSIEFNSEITPRDYFNFAVKDLEAPDVKYAAINAFTNGKRALHCQIDVIVDALGYQAYKNRNTFPAKLDYCAKCGIVTPRILRKMNMIRNQVEHDYHVPTLDEANDFIDIVELFLAATDRLLYRFPDNIVFPGVDENFDDKYKDVFNVKLVKGKGEVVICYDIDDEMVKKKVVAPSLEFFMWVKFINACTN
ncbi:hypothetical protein CGK41_24580 [Vibrio parahaemolyticus]|uniref:hypothetical protein n=1 Tax=Vibrio parahaemolyticus TaxID=670 RepID=UPI0011223C47|nr:hypothetical protein [Vibrio parahaemolyticus]TNZ67877.1 hypothetical protein CGK41_24580 [Vibrio parahaemolyticus]